MGVLALLVIFRFNLAPGVINANLIAQRITSINTQTYSARVRFELWGVAVKMFEHTFPFGIGAKNFPAQAPNYGVALPGGPPSNAHDALLVILSELGVPGLLATAWILIATARALLRSMKTKIEPRRSLSVALSASFLALLVDAITDYSYGEDSFLLSVILLAALLARLDGETSAQMPVVRYAVAAERVSSAGTQPVPT
jgi:O-antigen ligase